jgi:hypothetical protein
VVVNKNKKKSVAGTTITITALDIKRGKPEHATLCMVARAGRRALGRKVACDGARLHVPHADGITVYALPKRAVKATFDFDYDKASVRPFTFKLGKRVS